jgi:hypothetical protein
MRRIDEQSELDTIIGRKEGFLGNENLSGSRTWHNLAHLQAIPGKCGGKDTMLVAPPGGYKKYVVATEGEIPRHENRCRWCWLK